jgi:hypothetical protein
MTETERIRQRLAVVQAEKQQAETNWQRCEGALQVLRHMLGEVMREEDAVQVETPAAVETRMNGEMPASAGPPSE